MRGRVATNEGEHESERGIEGKNPPPDVPLLPLQRLQAPGRWTNGSRV